ncbi:MAG: TetR/AcrR family transcriptional regulator [Ktedonobacteraceae bacterium]|nr:TetR/AcrR family transcriptional regulator [Ktedonobacteraceae bacterium]MBO0791351.1 TetR/AcrR family transcriptional regulator [Ktedonobacteraceae bacterium]
MTQQTGARGEGAPKGDKRERTRAKLIEVAAQVIGEKGYERVTLEEVARRAGMTRGAIYGNFKNRDDLILAVVTTRWQPIAPSWRPGASLKEQLRLLADAVVASVPARRTQAVGAFSFQQYALTHEELRARLVETNIAIYRWAEHSVLQVMPESILPMPVDQFVKVLHALTEGLLYLRFLTPELITDEVIRAAFEALA